MIPNVIHRVWLGPEPMPEAYRGYGESWRGHHPGWEMRLWTDTQVAELDCAEAVPACAHIGQASDLVRLEILSRYGGVYVDADVECLRALDPLIAEVELFAAYESSAGRVVGTAVVGARPRHPAIDQALEEGCRRVGWEGLPGTSPSYLTEVLERFPEAVIFAPETFYPYHHTELFRRDESFPDAYAVHHWGSTWHTREMLMRRVAGLQSMLGESERARGQAEREKETLEQMLSVLEGGAARALKARMGSVAQRGLDRVRRRN